MEKRMNLFWSKLHKNQLLMGVQHWLMLYVVLVVLILTKDRPRKESFKQLWPLEAFRNPKKDANVKRIEVYEVTNT